MADPNLSLAATKRLLEDTSLRNCLTELPSLHFTTDAPPKPHDTVKLTTITTLAEALKASLKKPYRGRSLGFPPHIPSYLSLPLTRTLAAYNILSAPVSDAKSNEYVGIIDVVDILNGMLHAMYPELLKEGYVQAHKRLSMTELQAIGIECSSQSVAGLVHGGDLWYKGDRESTLYEIVVSGFRVGLPPKVHSPHHHLRVHHRVAIFDILPGEQTPDGPIPEWRITDIVSQTDVLRILASRMDALAAQDKGLSASLQALGMVQGESAVATVTADTPTLLVLARMSKEKLSGIGIVGKSGGPLLANLSTSDVRGLTQERFGALALPVGAFLLLMHPGMAKEVAVNYEDALLDQLPVAIKEGRWDEALAGLKLLSCNPQTTLREAIELLVRHGKHRAYICDEGGKGVGVVTPTDILRAVTLAAKGK